ncbi:TRM32 protein [Spatholobus suberectus]|nr:TRM32 protein [Spatholobus suberectus]
MAKRSQRFPVNYERDQSGCMWGLISIFDFRHGRFTRKLIADKRHGSKHAVGAAVTKNKFEALSNLDEEYQGNFNRGESKRLMPTTDADKLSVKKLIEEEMIIDQDEIKDQGNAEVESKQSRLGCEDPPKTDSKRKKKSCKKNRDMDSHDVNLDATLKSEFPHNQHSRQQSKDNLDLDKIMDDFCHVEAACSMMHDDDGKINAQSDKKHVISENLANAIHEFVNQMILNGKDLPEDGQFLSSRELMEALQVISSDKQLFVRLLQDPNSHLLKYIQELENVQGKGGKECSSVTGSNCSEQELVNLKQTREIANRKHRSFFRKRVKSQSKDPTNENGKTEFSNRIVILKPALTGMPISESGNNLASSLDSHDIAHYKGPSVRVGSHFSLTEIKRKLKHAMGKERHGNPEVISQKLLVERQNKVPRGKSIGKDNAGMRSPNKDHFFIEKIARPMFDVVKGNKTGTLKDSELNVEHESGTPIQRVSNIYIEAKKHLCEMLDSADENTNISSRQIPKTLGRILSLPEYNFSPLESPGRDLENHVVTAQARFSSSDKTREVSEDILSPKPATFIGLPDQETNNSEKQSSICDESSNNKVQEIKSVSNFSHDVGHVDISKTCCPVRDEIVTEESTEEKNDLESSLDPNGFITEKDQNIDISEIPDGAGCSECLNQDITEENQLSSPHSFITKKNEELESGTDVSGRPSPVSVLDTSFSDDDFGPRHSKCQPVKLPVRPLQIQFEEHDSSPAEQFDRGKYCLEESEVIYDYIKAVLHASGLTRDQLLMKCLSSDKILDPSLFDRVEFFSSLLCHDQKLLFDSINEVLMEICEHYFGVSPWVSFVNPGMRPAPNMKRVTFKVWEGVCWHVLPLPPLRTLEQIVRKDMERNGTWMDLGLDAETIGFEMGEDILAELMEETMLSLVSESPESKCSLLQFELKDNESSFHL